MNPSQFKPYNADFRMSVLLSTLSILSFGYGALALSSSAILSPTIAASFGLGLILNRVSARRFDSGANRLFGETTEKEAITTLTEAGWHRGWTVVADQPVPGRSENIDAVVRANGKTYTVEVKAQRSPFKIRRLRNKHRAQSLRQGNGINADGSILWYPLAHDGLEDIHRCAEVRGRVAGVIEAIAQYEEVIIRHRRYQCRIRFGGEPGGKLNFIETPPHVMAKNHLKALRFAYDNSTCIWSSTKLLNFHEWRWVRRSLDEAASAGIKIDIDAIEVAQ